MEAPSHRRYTRRRLDNVTHTLAGLVVAEAAIALRGRKQPVSPALARAAWLSSALANNFPDLDFAYAGITGGPLGYLLHHRGHTHTFALAPVVAIVPFLLARLALRRWGQVPSRAGDTFLYGLAVLGACLHIVMDAGNSYGVHPFWPVSSRWFYGDTIFILEPSWWLTLSIPLAFSTKPRAGRAVLFGIAALALLLSVVTGYVSSLAIAALALLALGLVVVSRRIDGDGGRAVLSIGASLAVAFTFASARALVEPRARAALDGAFPSANEVDLVMWPEPANPFCWNVLAVAVEGGTARSEELVLRRLVVAAVPAIHPAALCRMVPSPESTADDAPIGRTGHQDVRFFSEARVSVAELRAARDEHCDAAAFLRMSRAPFLVWRGDDEIIGDYRFDREEDLSFGELVLPELLVDCPTFVPGWEPPRSDVLDGTYAPEVRIEDDWD